MVLARDLEPEGVSVNVVFPGRASTSMTRSFTPQALPGALKLMLPLVRFPFREDGGKSAAKAARSTIWSATSSDLDGVRGLYFDTNFEEPTLHPTATDPEVQSGIVRVIEAVGNQSSTTSGR